MYFNVLPITHHNTLDSLHGTFLSNNSLEHFNTNST